MPRRKIEFRNGGIYHVYNRGVEKRDIVCDPLDQLRFLESLNVFNTTEPFGLVFRERKQIELSGEKLVEIIAFNLMDNHYHLVLKQLADDGVGIFMKSVGGGYANYFNTKYKRSGPLFQGVFKASPVDEWKMEEIVSYVNLNHLIHGLCTSANMKKWGMRSSWREYGDKLAGIVEISKWSGFNKKNSIEIAREIKRMREDIDKNEFE